jgi:tRNA-binding EMAP/Myf-like protein
VAKPSIEDVEAFLAVSKQPKGLDSLHRKSISTDYNKAIKKRWVNVGLKNTRNLAVKRFKKPVAKLEAVSNEVEVDLNLKPEKIRPHSAGTRSSLAKMQVKREVGAAT